MKFHYYRILFLTFVLSVSIYSSSLSQVKSTDIISLVNLMQGSFSSEEQSFQDSGYFNIILHLKRIWHDRTDGYWLYVEQALSDKPESPYRQRVYRVTNTYEGRFESAVFTIPIPSRFVFEWKKENPLPDLTPDSLSQRVGCSVILTLMNDGSYEGGTSGKDCAGEQRRADYVTSEVKISEEGILSWDRGFDKNDIQVWGAEKGGYFFKRIK